MKAKPQEQGEARRLRSEAGVPIKQIAARLGVSPGSVHLWTRDIVLTDAQRHRNTHGPRGPQNPEWIAKRAVAWRETCRRRRRRSQEAGREHARRADPLHLAGCMLYWAEGHKSRGTVRLTNSDPNLLVFFRRFLTESLQVAPERLRVSLHVYLGNGLTIEQIEDHWLEVLALPRSCLRKHMINPLPTSSSGKKRNKLPYGVCTLQVSDTHLLQHIYGAIQEYGGFDEPRWLDGPPTKRRPRRTLGADLERTA